MVDEQIGLFRTILYFGQIICQKEYERLVDNTVISPEFLHCIGDHHILHDPGRYLEIEMTHSVLEKHELERDWVDLQEVVRKILSCPELATMWVPSLDDQLFKLNEYVKMATGAIKSITLQHYIAEFQRAHPLFGKAILRRNIVCKNPIDV